MADEKLNTGPAENIFTEAVFLGTIQLRGYCMVYIFL